MGKVWNDLRGMQRRGWQSERVVREMLARLHPSASSGDLYERSNTVAAAARQAQAFVENAARVDISLTPLLRYYALLHWMKVMLYSLDLRYPPSTSVLQHGLSVRRNKRHLYRWTQESVHVYRDGVLQSMWQQIGDESPLPAKFNVGDLVGQLPPMSPLLRQLQPELQRVYPVHEDGAVLTVNRRIAAHRGFTVAEWRQAYLQRCSTEVQSASLSLPQPAPLDPDGQLRLPHPGADHPWFLVDGGGAWLWDGDPDPQWLIHFVLLFTLGSLCRYNPLEWQEVLHWTNETDAVMVREYLTLYEPEGVIDSLFSSSP